MAIGAETVTPVPEGPGAATNAFKAIIYLLLIVNCIIFFMDDWQAARGYLNSGASLQEWFDAFPTALDDLAWLVLALIYEFETAWARRNGAGPRHRLRHAAVVLCYFVILHTFYVYLQDLGAVYRYAPLTGVDSACDVSGAGYYFFDNQHYTEVRADNCAALGRGSEYFRYQGNTITDAAGLFMALIQSWAAVLESGLWILIVTLLAAMTIVQERGVSRSRLFRVADISIIIGYTLIALISFYWAWMDWPIYLWDNFLWTGAFAAIELNLLRWRRRLRRTAAT